MTRRTAVQKRDGAPAPHVTVLAEPKGPAFPAGRMLISSPAEIGALVARVPRGHVATLGALRAALATAHGADYTCPITTGLFLRIAREAALEEGRDDVPTWRVVRDDGAMLGRTPDERRRQAARLADEGVPIESRAGAPRVAALDARAVALR